MRADPNLFPSDILDPNLFPSDILEVTSISSMSPSTYSHVRTTHVNTLPNNNCLPKLAGTRVLALGVHLYGNLGDEMEITPMLQELKRCGVLTTGVLGAWSQPNLDDSSVREHGLFENIITLDDEEFLKEDYYHAVLFVPGPWMLHGQNGFSQRYRNQWPHGIDIFFGGSITDKDTEGMGETITKQYKPSLVVFREKQSLEKFKIAVKSFEDFETKLMYSSDLSHSFDYSEASMQFWKRFWEKKNLTGKKVMFIRSNNFKTDSYEVLRDMRQVKIITIEKNEVILDADDIVFATTATNGEGDPELFSWIQRKYKGLFRPEQFQELDIVEKAWALIAISQEVFTDRYHPGVAAHRLGKNVTIVNYEGEKTKMIGLRDVIASSSTKENRALNLEAFRTLQETLVMLKEKNNGRVTPVRSLL